MMQPNKLTSAALVSIALFISFTVKAGQDNAIDEKQNMLNFAHANCMFWYFKSKNYDLTDIRAISGGFVELGSSSAEKYQEIALFIKNYKTDRKTKHNIDPKLLKCFYLEENDELNKLIDSLL